MKKLGLAWDIKLPQFKEPRKAERDVPVATVPPPDVETARVPVSAIYGD